MSSSDKQPGSEQRPTGIGPGERLQAARIQQGLSLDDVANRMHLSASILEALEDNNFEEITAPIFVKGYLRAYARIVALDEDDMIQQYIEYYSEEDPPITSTSNMAPELSVTDARIKWTTYLVILVLGALLAAWWWNKQQDQEMPISLDGQGPALEQPADTVAEVVGSEIEAVSESMPEAVSESTPVGQPMDTGDSAQTAAVEPEVTPQPEPEPPETAMAEAVESEPVAEMVADTVAAVQGDSQAGDDSGAGFIGVQMAPTGNDKLQIIVHADTWADIKDSTDYQLVYDLLRADASLEITGEAPFTVFLGNGHGVELMINGEEVDFASRIRGDNTARLKIGG